MLGTYLAFFIDWTNNVHVDSLDRKRENEAEGVHHRRGYVFEGWSYNSRRLEEVRPGDRIYYPTTLYAILTKQKAKNDEEVEAIDTRAVNEHKAYMFGYHDGTFRPNAFITRCEAVVILNKIFDRKYDEISPIHDINSERIKRFIDLTESFWGYNDMVEATNSHSFKRRVPGRVEED